MLEIAKATTPRRSETRRTTIRGRPFYVRRRVRARKILTDLLLERDDLRDIEANFAGLDALRLERLFVKSMHGDLAFVRGRCDDEMSVIRARASRNDAWGWRKNVDVN